MNRRLYFIFSNNRQAEQAFADLKKAEVAPEHMHALSRADVDLGTLPPATEAQRNDLAGRMENLVWRSNLVLFALGLTALLLGIYLGTTTLSLLGLVVMLLSFIAGAMFASLVPDAHVDEFRGALAHGDIVLLVDVPRQRHGEIEELMRQRHAAAVPGGSSWTIDGLGI